MSKSTQRSYLKRKILYVKYVGKYLPFPSVREKHKNMHIRKNKEKEMEKEKSKEEGKLSFELYLSELLRLEGLRNRKFRQAFLIQDNFGYYACDLCKFKTIIRRAMLPHRQHEHQIESKYK